MVNRARRVNMAIRMLRREQSPSAILSALMKDGALSRRQAYRYLVQAQRGGQLLPIPGAKAVFTLNLPQALIRQVRKRCREEGRRISHVVAELLQEWLDP